MSTCYNPIKPTSPRISDTHYVRNIKTICVSSEIKSFPKEFVESLSSSLRDASLDDNLKDTIQLQRDQPVNFSLTPTFLDGIASSTSSLISDSNYDSGAFSRNSSPELTLDLQNRFHEEVEPLKSPPLVLSVTHNGDLPTYRRDKDDDTIDVKLVLLCLSAAAESSQFDCLKHAVECGEPDAVQTNTAVHVIRPDDTETEAKSKVPAKESCSAVTVTIGSSTRLCINDTQDDPLQSQSLPNLNSFKSESGLKLDQDGRGRIKMPHMGTSRLVTPTKPPHIKPPTLSLERNRISTVLLTRSSTSNSSVFSPTPKYNSPTSKEDILQPLPYRNVRGGSCSSDSSSGVSSCTDTVTVNGSHHCW